MTVDTIMKQLEEYGDENTKRILMKHGAKEPFFGVKVADLKKILKKTKKNHDLSLELYKTGNSDAMYLAGLMADEKKITRENLNEWVENAYWYYLSEFTLPGVASETDFGMELGLEWIKSNKENIASAGWMTLASYAGVNDDKDLDLSRYEQLLTQIARDIHGADNRVRHTMNGFVISVGMYISDLTQKAIETARKIGKIHVDMGGTACKVPLAEEYLLKAIDKGRVGKKRKTARC